MMTKSEFLSQEQLKATSWSGVQSTLYLHKCLIAEIRRQLASNYGARSEVAELGGWEQEIRKNHIGLVSVQLSGESEENLYILRTPRKLISPNQFHFTLSLIILHN